MPVIIVLNHPVAKDKQKRGKCKSTGVGKLIGYLGYKRVKLHYHKVLVI